MNDQSKVKKKIVFHLNILTITELDAYAKMVSVLRAQGPLTEGKQKLLGDLATALHIPNERHQAEIRRAVNDDKLSLVADK